VFACTSELEECELAVAAANRQQMKIIFLFFLRKTYLSSGRESRTDKLQDVRKEVCKKKKKGYFSSNERTRQEK
jgi:hypothetical protein